MDVEKILITGGYGCIGAETAKWLLRNTEAHVVICSRRVDDERTARVFHDVDHARLSVIAGDVRDQSCLEKILSTGTIDRVAHLAALQTPDCNRNRDLGLQINLGGTQNLIEAIKARGTEMKRFVFASSIAVYGPRSAYPPGQVPMLAEPKPVNVYGAWKNAGEHLSRLFFDETGIPTISLRPGVLFGPGRDAGLTASPTTAIKCVALGRAYEIPFRTRQDYQYAPDVGAAVGNALIAPFDRYGVYTLPGRTMKTVEIVETLREVAEELGLGSRFHITTGAGEVPFICDLDDQPFRDQFPKVHQTPFELALRQSLDVFVEQAKRGWLTEQDVL